jgi:hypothetical protein
MESSGPGCVLRASLVTFGLMFVPAAFWLAHRGLAKYWPQSFILLLIAIAFLRLGMSRRENSWITLMDDLAKSKRR